MPATHVDQALADQMLEKAIQATAGLKFHDDLVQTRQALNLGRCDVCGVVSDCLVRQIGEYLGQMDRTVKAVYKYEPEYATLRPTLRAGNPPAAVRRGGINLVAWVERKSAALNALGASLENALSESRRSIQCNNASPACYILDIQMIEDREVQESRGYGLVVNSMFVRSAQVWRREQLAVDSERWTVGNLPTGDRPPGEAFPRRAWEREEVQTTRAMEDLLALVDPEYAPESALFEQGSAIEKLSDEERRPYEHRLREIKVALIRRLISDQLAYINIAKEWFTIGDLAEIFQRKIGYGRIGGKAAGMALAARILNEVLEEPLRACIRTPESYFLGSDLIYIFMAMNGLMHWNNQKYKPEDQIRSEYPQIRKDFLSGEFPPEVLEELRLLLGQIGSRPIIVRSSSLLEDNFGTAFAGKYESVFLPNQASPEENLHILTHSIARIYASTLKPDALLYRRSQGLQDYDERMAILIQTVQGERFGNYFFPFGAGVAFSRNLYRWSPQIRREDGFIRMVWGLGTRAVERVGNDYSRLVALSHPTLHPDDTPEAIRYYSQQYMDLIDLEANQFKTVKIHDVIHPDYPSLRFLAQIEEDGYFATPRGRVMAADVPRLAVTYDELLRRSNFAGLMSRMLRTLEEHYHVPVDLEFTLQVLPALPGAEQHKPQVMVSLLQCRPQSFIHESPQGTVPKHLDPESILFSTCFMVPRGYVGGIRHVLFVSPEEYFRLPTQSARTELRRSIAQLNSLLDKKSFICVGPGRWGTVNPDLGVFVAYSDINNCAALIELSGKGVGPAPDPSLGTHFFQDLMEANIYPVAVCLDEKGTVFNRKFFYKAENQIQKTIKINPELAECLRLIDVAAYAPGCHLELVMDDEKNQAVAFLTKVGS